MVAGRGTMILICLLAIWSPGGEFALAQGQDEKAETEESKKGTEEEKKAEETAKEEEKKQARPTAVSETVTVTATRVESDVMKTPVAVTVIDQDTMDREGIRSVEGIAQMVPNMDIATKNGQSTPMISLRGIRSTNETELGDPSVGVHLDGIYSPRMQGILAMMFDNERVEVMRGPQGTLFGRNSTVGSINIVTAKPQLDEYSTRLMVQGGNYNAPELQAMVNLPVSETFGFRFAGRYYQRDSYIDGYWDPNQYDQRFIGDKVQNAAVVGTGSDCSGPGCYTRTQHSNWWAEDDQEIRALVPADPGDFYMNAKEWGYRASARWQPKHQKMSLDLLFQHYRQDSAGGIDMVNCDKLRGRPNYKLFIDESDPENADLWYWDVDPDNPVSDCNDLLPKDDTYQAVVNVPGMFKLDIKYVRSQFNLDIKNNLRFVYNLGFEYQDRESVQDMEQSLNAWDQAMYFLPGTGSHSWMNEIQFQSYGNRRLNWIAGANLFHETTNTMGFFDNTIDTKDMWIQPDRSTNAGAVFAQGTYSFSPKWHLTLGYRFSDETKQDKGGRTYNCEVAGNCATQVPTRTIPCDGDGCPRQAFDLDGVPTDYFADPSVYVQPPAANDTKASWSHHDWRIGLDYDRNENTLLYTYLATGFKAGGVGDVINDTEYIRNPAPECQTDPAPFCTTPFIPGDTRLLGTSFDPEEVITLELGFKQRFMDGRLNLRGAYFFSDYRDMQYAAVGTLGFSTQIGTVEDPITGEQTQGPVLTPVIAYFTDNVPGAEIQGFELEYDWRPWKGGRIVGYASWLDTKITEDWVVDWGYDPISYFGLSFANVFQDPDPVLQANLRGNNLAVSPPFKLHFTLDHAFFVKRWGATIVPWVTVHWEDASYLTIWNVDRHTDDMQFVIRPEDVRYTDDRREAWSMVHTGLRFFITGGWQAELFVYNVTNEVVQWWGGAAEGVAKGSFSMPLNYGFRVGYQF